MTGVIDQWSRMISQLVAAIEQLSLKILPLQLAPIDQREWYELLKRKLQPQLGQHSFLIVAIVGGTNIGKSVIFNHIAGERISSTSPLASGTKHPTVLASNRLSEQLDLNRLFQGFQVLAWKDAGQPLESSQEHRLFYRTTDKTPENLLILDTPDVDSVEEVNWERADHIRQSADVLIAVLTQQKYNDAAVKEFFRKAAQEDKLVIVVFNQCLLPEDEDYWPLWVKTFCDETGVLPHLLYLAPNDRRAAESNQLPFYERSWPQTDQPSSDVRSPRSLLTDLSELRFDEIKTRALSGALKHLIDPQLGIPGWLQEIRRRGDEYGEALQLMTAGRLVEIDRWPTLPNSVLIEHIRRWWREQREGWSASVHGFYFRIGKVISYPVQAVMKRGQAPSDPPIEQYRKQEWEAVLEVVERCLDRLTWLRELGNPLLSPRLDQLLDGTAREKLISHLRDEHARIDFEKEVSTLVDGQLQHFQEERPDAYQLFRRVDSVAAAARPAVSLVLFMTGAGPLGEAIAPMLADTAVQGMLHIAGETVGGTVVTAVGDKVITETASTSAGYLEARFRQLHIGFAQQRTEWMVREIEHHLLREFPNELEAAATIADSQEFKDVSELVEQFRQQLEEVGTNNPTGSEP